MGQAEDHFIILAYVIGLIDTYTSVRMTTIRGVEPKRLSVYRLDVISVLYDDGSDPYHFLPLICFVIHFLNRLNSVAQESFSMVLYDFRMHWP